MGIDKDSGKDIVLGSTAVTGIVLGLSPLALALSGTLVALGWNKVARHAQQRAEKLVQFMIIGDEEPESFAQRLHARVEAEPPDDAVLAGFRALLMSAVQAVTPEALPAMGFIGRRLFRGECTLHDARAALSVLDVVDACEFQNLRGLMAELAALSADVLVFGEFPPRDVNENTSWGALVSNDQNPGGPRARHPITPFAGDVHLFTTMKRAGAGNDTAAYGIGGSPRAIELERSIITLFHDALSFQPD